MTIGSEQQYSKGRIVAESFEKWQSGERGIREPRREKVRSPVLNSSNGWNFLLIGQFAVWRSRGWCIGSSSQVIKHLKMTHKEKWM